uniref:Uncharacterized protein n=1 Tax=Panagrolaimus superbus TaxID=310955 RepID=A0A914YFA6_9BILA
MDKPNISAKFIDKTGVNLTIEIPNLEVEGDATIDAFFTAESHMSVVVKNWTINLDVKIQRELDDDRNNITVSFILTDYGRFM